VAITPSLYEISTFFSVTADYFFYCFVVWKIKPMSLHVKVKHSAIEPHPQLLICGYVTKSKIVGSQEMCLFNKDWCKQIVLSKLAPVCFPGLGDTAVADTQLPIPVYSHRT
jgi:hypothetical protein